MHENGITVSDTILDCKKWKIWNVLFLWGSNLPPKWAAGVRYGNSLIVRRVSPGYYSGAPAAAKRSPIPIQKGESRACMENKNPCNSFLMSQWLAAWIAGACAQRRRRRRTTWRPYSFLPLIPSFSLQLSSLIFDIHVTNDSRCWSNVLKTGLHWSKIIKITAERKN